MEQTISAPLMVLESWLPRILSMSLAMHTTVLLSLSVYIELSYLPYELP